MKRSKRKIRFDRIIIFLVLVLLTSFLCFYLLDKLFKPTEIEKKNMYIGSSDLTAPLYDMEYNEVSSVIRGKEVIISQDSTEYNNQKYYKLRYNDNDYYILENNLVLDIKDVVMEDKMYVRTPVTIYKDFTNPDIAGLAKKGSELEILGYDKLNEDGSVNMYNIKTENQTGYVYSKYLVSTKEESLKNYDEDGLYKYHENRKFSYELYGGSSNNLDYYPYEKPEFEDNIMPDEVRSLYLNCWPGVLGNIDSYINLAKNTGVNAFVVDIKDGALAYESDVAKEYSPTSYKYSGYTKEEYKAIIKKIKDAGFYVVGRIVVFNDPQFASDNASETIKTNNGNNTSWVSAYSRKAWEYNVKLSIEAVELFDFDEIQFDYIRFPEASYSWSSKGYDYRNTYNEEKAQAIQNFLFYATDQIHKYGVYVSADVFGESSYTYVSAYGQYWPAISNVVDAISGMPYTDHFNRNDASTWENPYSTVYSWALTAAARQKEIPTPAQARTWLTAYDTPNWNPYVIYGANEFKAQINALDDAGLIGGYITWNGASSYSKYASIISAFGG